MTTFGIVVSAAASVAFGAVEPDPAANAAEVASGLVSRTLEMKGGRILGRSYKTADGTEFMRGGSPEFAFRVDGRLYSGRSSWKDARVAKRTRTRPRAAVRRAEGRDDGVVTLDLSMRSTALGSVSSATGGKRELSFEENATIKVSLGTKRFEDSRILSWTEDTKPANIDTVKFVRADADRRYSLVVKDDGLYANVGLTFSIH